MPCCNQDQFWGCFFISYSMQPHNVESFWAADNDIFSVGFQQIVSVCVCVFVCVMMLRSKWFFILMLWTYVEPHVQLKIILTLAAGCDRLLFEGNEITAAYSKHHHCIFVYYWDILEIYCNIYIHIHLHIHIIYLIYIQSISIKHLHIIYTLYMF